MELPGPGEQPGAVDQQRVGVEGDLVRAAGARRGGAGERGPAAGAGPAAGLTAAPATAGRTASPAAASAVPVSKARRESGGMLGRGAGSAG